ncbi:hypothetical protein YC2023_059391 [Brassica napus]
MSGFFSIKIISHHFNRALDKNYKKSPKLLIITTKPISSTKPTSAAEKPSGSGAKGTVHSGRSGAASVQVKLFLELISFLLPSPLLSKRSSNLFLIIIPKGGISKHRPSSQFRNHYHLKINY